MAVVRDMQVAAAELDVAGFQSGKPSCACPDNVMSSNCEPLLLSFLRTVPPDVFHNCFLTHLSPAHIKALISTCSEVHRLVWTTARSARVRLGHSMLCTLEGKGVFATVDEQASPTKTLRPKPTATAVTANGGEARACEGMGGGAQWTPVNATASPPSTSLLARLPCLRALEARVEQCPPRAHTKRASLASFFTCSSATTTTSETADAASSSMHNLLHALGSSPALQSLTLCRARGAPSVSPAARPAPGGSDFHGCHPPHSVLPAPAMRRLTSAFPNLRRLELHQVALQLDVGTKLPLLGWQRLEHVEVTECTLLVADPTTAGRWPTPPTVAERKAPVHALGAWLAGLASLEHLTLGRNDIARSLAELPSLRRRSEPVPPSHVLMHLEGQVRLASVHIAQECGAAALAALARLPALARLRVSSFASYGGPWSSGYGAAAMDANDLRVPVDDAPPPEDDAAGDGGAAEAPPPAPKPPKTIALPCLEELEIDSVGDWVASVQDALWPAVSHGRLRLVVVHADMWGTSSTPTSTVSRLVRLLEGANQAGAALELRLRYAAHPEPRMVSKAVCVAADLCRVVSELWGVASVDLELPGQVLSVESAAMIAGSVSRALVAQGSTWVAVRRQLRHFAAGSAGGGGGSEGGSGEEGGGVRLWLRLPLSLLGVDWGWAYGLQAVRQGLLRVRPCPEAPPDGGLW